MVLRGSVFATPPTPTQNRKPKDGGVLVNQWESSEQDDTKDSVDKTDKPDKNYSANIAGSMGYDSNLDEEVGGRSAAFQRYDVDASYRHKGDDGEIRFDFDGSAKRFFDVEEDDQWRYQVGIVGERNYEKEKITIGINREHDTLNEDDTTTNEAYLQIDRNGRFANLRMRGTLEHETASFDQDDEDEPTSAPTFVERSIETEVRILPDRTLSPFLRATISGVSFQNQDEDDLNRNAGNYSAVAGISIKPNDRFRLDIGGRINLRHFDDQDLATETNAFLDVRLAWNPNDDLEVTGSVTRELDNPDNIDSVFSDSTTYEAALEWQATEKTSVELSAELSETRDSDSEDTTKELTVSGKLSQQVHDNLSLFVALDQLWARESESEEPPQKYQRTEIRTGLEVEF